MLDMRVTGGTVVDGTGAPGRRADIGISDGGGGLGVAPGVGDIPTPYDAQLFWDSAATPSPFHGVTTVVGGNCGFTIAPVEPSEVEYLTRMLSRVEGMPLESLAAGVPWDWQTFGEYLDRLDGTLAVNAGFLVGHSALRRVAMGDRSHEPATDDDVTTMCRMLGESLTAGALGFSSSQAPTHNDGDGEPVPSRAATRDELVALSQVVGDYPGPTLEFIPTVGPFSDEHVALMAAMSASAGRPLNWNVLVVGGGSDTYQSQLEASDRAAEQGGRVLALTVPAVMQLHL